MKFLLTGGGKCKYCKSEKTTKVKCPWNPDAIRKNKTDPKKHPNAKGVPTGFAEKELKKAGLWNNFKKASASSSNSTDSSLSPPKPVAPKIKKSSPKPAAKPTPKPKPAAKPTPNNKCTPEKEKICEEKNKICNPQSGRCKKSKTKPKAPSPKPKSKPETDLTSSSLGDELKKIFPKSPEKVKVFLNYMKSPILKVSTEPDIKWSSLIENFNEEIPEDIIGLGFKSKSASFVNNKNEKLPTSKTSLKFSLFSNFYGTSGYDQSVEELYIFDTYVKHTKGASLLQREIKEARESRVHKEFTRLLHLFQPNKHDWTEKKDMHWYHYNIPVYGILSKLVAGAYNNKKRQRLLQIYVKNVLAKKYKTSITDENNIQWPTMEESANLKKLESAVSNRNMKKYLLKKFSNSDMKSLLLSTKNIVLKESSDRNSTKEHRLSKIIMEVRDELKPKNVSKPMPKKVKTPAPVPNPTKKSPESDSDSDPEDIIPVKPTDVVPKVVPEVVPEVVLETRSIAVIYMEDIGTELERVRLLRNGVQQIYKLGLAYKGGSVQYRNLYKDEGELSIEGRCIIKEPYKMDIQWTI